MAQSAVEKLSELGTQLTDDLDEDQLLSAEKFLKTLEHPLEPDDIRLLLSLLPKDGATAYGLNWSILHAIEAAPCWPLWELLDDQNNEWIRTFRVRLRNGGFLAPDAQV